jgi:hypothetical protein
VDVLWKERIIACIKLVLDSMKRKVKKRTVPSSYDTMPYYFPTEQVDNVRRLKVKRKRK